MKRNLIAQAIRRTTLVGTTGAVIIGSVASYAATADITLDLTSLSLSHNANGPGAGNGSTGTVIANISDVTSSELESSIIDSSVTGETELNNSNANNNVTSASATVAGSDNSTDLGLLSSAQPDAAIATGTLSADNDVTSSVQGSQNGFSQTGDTVSLKRNDNTTSASTVLTESVAVAETSTELADVDSTSAGSTSQETGSEPASLSSEGGVSIASAQVSLGDTANAVVTDDGSGGNTDSSITSTVSSGTAASVSNSKIEMTGNNISASFVGNSSIDADGNAGNSIILDNGASDFNGSAVLGNSQSLIDLTSTGLAPGGETPMAANINSLIRLDVDGVEADAGSIQDSSSLALDNNTISAGATGNAASNEITSSLAVTSTGDVDSTLDTTTTENLATELSGDSVLQNTQTAAGAFNNGDPANLGTAVNGGRVIASVANVSDSSAMSVSGNSVSGSALGNDATNRIALTDQMDYTAGAVMGNVQTNDDVLATASVANNSIRGEVTEGGVESSVVNVNDNTILATAGGNNADNSMKIASSTSIGGEQPNPMNLELDGDASVVNSADSVITSRQTAIGDASEFRAQAIGGNRIRNAIGPEGVGQDSEVSLNNNTIMASTLVNKVSSNTLSLDSDTSINSSGVIANSQRNELPNRIEALAGGANSSESGTQALIETVVEGGSASILDVTGNQVVSNAVGNDTSRNDAAGDQGNLINVNSDTSIGGEDASQAFADTTTGDVDIGIESGGFAIGNQQVSDADYFSRTLNGLVSLDVADDGVGADVSNNMISSNALSNDADSRIMLSALNGGVQTSGVITNQQDHSGSIESLTARSSIEATFGGVITDGAVSVNGNTIESVAGANAGTNTIQVESGTEIASTAQSEHPGGGYRFDYGILSQQNATGDVTSATNGSSVQLDLSDVVGTDMKLNNNAVQADSQANTINNQLTLTGEDLEPQNTSISATGDIANTQTYTSSEEGVGVTSTLAGSQISANLGELSDESSLTMQGNSLGASAGVNAANNVLAAYANTELEQSSGVVPGSEAPLSAQNHYTIQNIQSSDGDAVAMTSIAPESGISVEASSADIPKVDISNNSITAIAEQNQASNSILLNASTISTPSVIGNNQSVNGASTQAAINGAASGDAGIVANLGAGVSMDNNTIGAQADGNRADNLIDAQAGTSFTADNTGEVGEVGPSQNADYAVLNNQSYSGADVSASVNGVRIASSSPVANGGGSQSGSDNRILASANVNTANNRVTTAQGNLGGAPTSAINSVQSSTETDVTASVNNASVGMSGTSGGAGGVSGNAGMSGKRISANATGNTVSNRVGGGNGFSRSLNGN